PIVVTLDEPLVRPVRRLVAPGATLAPVPRVDPARPAVARPLPTAGNPSPLVVLPVPRASDPDRLAIGPGRPALMAHSRRSVVGDADVERPQVCPDLRTRRNGHEDAQRREHDCLEDACAHVESPFTRPSLRVFGD